MARLLTLPWPGYWPYFGQNMARLLTLQRIYIYIYIYIYMPTPWAFAYLFCGLEAKTCLSQLHLIKATTWAKAKKGYVGPQLKGQLGLNLNPNLSFIFDIKP